MAKNFDEVYASVYTTGNKMGWGNALLRNNGIPVDMSSIYDSFESLVIYAATDPTAYEGQIVAVTENGESIAYIITPTKQDTLEASDGKSYDVFVARIGTVTIGDNETITIDEDTSILSLKDYKKKYSKYVPEKGTKGEDDYEPAHYDEVTVESDEDWDAVAANLELAVDANGIYWRERNTSTVQGLTSTVSDLVTGLATETEARIKADADETTARKEADTELDGKITAEATARKEADDALDDRIDDLDAAVAKTGTDNTFTKANTFTGTTIFSGSVTVPTPTAETNPATKTYVDTLVSTSISGLGSVFELKDVLTDEEFSIAASALNTDGNKYETGDVVLVKINTGTGKDINKEYVVVSDTDDSGETTLRFELLGDPSGVTALDTRTTSLEARANTVEETVGKIPEIYATKAELTKETEDRTDADNALEGKIAIEAEAREDADTALSGRIKTLEDLSIDTKYATKAELTKETEDRTAADNDEAKAREDADTALSGRIDTETNARTEADTALSGRIGTLETAVNDASTGLNVKVAALETASATHALKTDVDNSIKDLQSKDTALDTRIGALETAAPTYALDEDVSNSVAALEKADTDEAKARIDADSAETSAREAADAALSGRIKTLEDLSIDTKYATKVELTKETEDRTAADTALGTRIDTLSNTVDTKANAADVYDKTETDSAIKAVADVKADAEDVYTKTEVDNTVKSINDELAKKLVAGDAMVFKGTLGTGGTVTALPTTDVTNGDTYKVITDGTYNSIAAKVGDMFIAVVSATGTENVTTTIEWFLIPSGDDGNVYHSDDLTANQLVIGDDEKSVKTLAAGTNGQVLKVVEGKPTWVNAYEDSVTSSDGSMNIDDGDYTVAKVNCNLLYQTEGDYLIFDCGSSTTNI